MISLFKKYKTFPIALIYFAVAVLFTYPLVTKLSTSTYGYSGDNFGAIHYFWWWKKSLLAGLNHRDSYLEEAPFGVTIDNESGAALYYLPVKLLTLLTDAVTGYNLVLLLSFPAAALAMFWLAYRITGNRPASFIAGLIYAFSPYHLWKSYNHLDLALIWPLPIYTLALWNLIKEPLNKRMIIFKGSLAGLALTACILTNFYYGYFMLLMTVAVLLSNGLFGFWRQRKAYFPEILKQTLSLLLAGFLALLISLPFMYKTLLESRNPAASGESFLKQDSFHRPFDNLISLSGRPWDYLIPSEDHPLWGKYVPAIYEWIKTKSNDFKTISAVPHERTIYLGLVSLVFSLFTVILLRKNSLYKERYGGVVFVFFITALVLVVVSLPPFIVVKNIQINLPSFYLYKVFPMFRSYVRLGIVVLMLISLLAAVGINMILAALDRGQIYKKHRRSSSFFVVGFFSLFVLFDFANFPPAKVTDFSVVPTAYQWLKSQPGQPIILEWPPAFNVADGLLMQSVHQKGMANWSTQSPYYDFWKYLPTLYVSPTAKKLSGLGIDYVFVHKKLLFPQPNPVDDLWYTRVVKDPETYRSVPPGMVLAFDSPDITVFSIDEKNPAKIATIIKKNSGSEITLLGGNSWTLSENENSFYLYYFGAKEGDKGLSVKLSFNIIKEPNPENLRMSFNEKDVVFNAENLDLLLKPGENFLSFERQPSCLQCQPITIENISLQVL